MKVSPREAGVVSIEVESPSEIKNATIEPAEKTVFERDVFDLYTNTSIYLALRPLIASMQVFGLSHNRLYGSLNVCNDRIAKRHAQAQKPKLPWKHFISRLAAQFILLVIVTNSIRYCSAFTVGSNAFGPLLFFKGVLIAWTTLTCINSIVCYKGFCRYEGVPRFLLEWDSLHDGESQAKCLKKITKRVKSVTIISWVMMVVNTTLIWCGLFEAPQFLALFFVPLTLDHQHIDAMKALITILAPLFNAVWILPVAWDYMVCYTLNTSFTVWNEAFRSRCQDGTFRGDIVTERMRHQNLCRLVSYADDFLSLYKASAFSTNLGTVLFTISVCVYSPPDFINRPVDSLSLFIWLSVGAMILALALLGGSMVNTQAHDIFEDVMELRGGTDTAQVQLFISRLSGNSIGLTMAKMCVIDKSTILTTIGFLLSYAIIIIQLAPGIVSSTTNDATDSWNCTYLRNTTEL